jgi:RNA polymerase sigma-70 factor (ECF subfamily)
LYRWCILKVDRMHVEDPSRLNAFDQYRGLLFSIAYRMVGSVADAEDLLQEAFIRWQQASAADIRSPKAFLVTIVSRLSINHLQSARVRREEYVGQWLPEPLVTDPGIDSFGLLRAGESLSMAFLVLLERLTPTERAVFLLHEIFDYPYPEIAAALDRTEANCRQILRRARQHVHAARPRFTPPAGEHDDLLQRFIQATRSGDMDGLMSLLATDVVLRSDGGGKAPAVPNVIHGAAHVSRAALHGFSGFQPEKRVNRVVEINGDSGLVSYLNGQPFCVLTLTVGEGRIQGIFVITNPDKLRHLPPAPS